MTSLVPLLLPALPPPLQGSSRAPSNLARSVRCAEGAFGDVLYVGASDGGLHRYQLGNEGYVLDRTRMLTTSGKAIDRLYPLALGDHAGVLLVLAESTLHFLDPLTLEALPGLPRIGGVAAVVLDEQELRRREQQALAGVAPDADNRVSVVVVRRRVVLVARMGRAWETLKEIPIASGALLARRWGSALLLATTSTYSLLSLATSELIELGLPISQASSAPSAAERPSILPIPSADSDDCDFLITSHTTNGTLGVFVGTDGEVRPRLLEWPRHPRGLALEHGKIHALLRNDVLETHDAASLALVSRVPVPAELEPRLLSSGFDAFALPASASPPLRKAAVSLRNGKMRELASEAQSVSRRGKTLLIGREKVLCICEKSLEEKARALAAAEDWEQLEGLVVAAWETAGRGEPPLPLQFASLLLAFYLVRSVQFRKAARHLERGRVDPALLISWLDGATAPHPPVTEAVIFEELAHLLPLRTGRDIIRASLEFNYVPPLVIDDSALAQKLSAQLLETSEIMIRDVLIAFRGLPAVTRDERVTDTTLAKLLALGGDGTALRALLGSDNACDLKETEPLLERSGLFAALATVREARGDLEGVLQLWTRLIDGEIEDQAFEGGIADVVRLLESSRDPQLIKKHSLWVVQRDADAGIRLLTREAGSAALVNGDGATEDYRKTLSELKRLDPQAAEAFLEHMVLAREPPIAELHTELVELLISRVVGSDAEEKRAMAEVSDDYRSGGYAESFVAHLALRAASASSIVERLKLIMLLQGSITLDAEALLDRLEREELLLYERAVLLGKLRRDQEALQLLAVEMRDANSAEAYCLQAGAVLSPMLAESLAAEHGLALYSSLIARRAASEPSVKTRESTKGQLLRDLLQVYMRSGEKQELRTATAHLLNTQARHLPTLDVLAAVPDTWPVGVLETFLSRNLRQQLHVRRQGQIMRAASLAQNLEVQEHAWASLRAMGGVIQDEPDDNIPPPPVAPGGDSDEKALPDPQGAAHAGLAEKVAAFEYAAPSVTDLGADKEAGRTHQDTLAHHELA